MRLKDICKHIISPVAAFVNTSHYIIRNKLSKSLLIDSLLSEARNETLHKTRAK